MTHTPTPWHIEPTTSDELGVDICAGESRSKGTHIWIASVNGTHDNSEGFPRTTEECLANAAYIVKCVNAHETLLKTAKHLRQFAINKHWYDGSIKWIDEAIALAEAQP